MTALPSRRVYLDGTDLERDCEALMRFRLTYNGPLKAAKHPAMSGPAALYTDQRAEHKHDIRRELHRQLRHLWQTNEFLREMRMKGYEWSKDAYDAEVLPEKAKSIDWTRLYNEASKDKDGPLHGPRMVDVLAECYMHSGYRFVPLVRQELSLSCSLRVLFLRRDFPAPVLSAGDIDNRLKTLIDALRMPQPNEGVPNAPQPGEDPFFVLLDDDRQITHLEVETDIALAASEKEPSDISFARLVATIEVRPYNANMFNLNFA